MNINDTLYENKKDKIQERVKLVRDSKFLEFEQFLVNSKQEYIELTFEQIEDILGIKLSPSAYTYGAYWYLSPTHTFPRTWLNAGYNMDKLDIRAEKVSFLRVGSEQIINNTNQRKDLKVISYLTKSEKPQIDIEFAIDKANEFLNSINGDENSRYLSWEHCYSSFADCKGLTEENLDTLSLHLAFYLASWGMYRGSSFLLQKDYRVHKDAVKEIFNPRYKPLWGISCSSLILNNNVDLVFELSDKLKEIYIEKRRNLDDYEDISSILITKILLGTLGCVPAYDRFFVDTIKTYKIASGNYNKKSLYDLALFYNENRDKLEVFRDKVNSSRGIKYSEMKLIDMSFWYIGRT